MLGFAVPVTLTFRPSLSLSLCLSLSLPTLSLVHDNSLRGRGQQGQQDCAFPCDGECR